MKKISFWARKNYWAARILIIIIKLLLIGIGIYTGQNLKSLGIFFSPFIFYFTVAVLLLAALYYPGTRQKKALAWKAFYIKQKAFDLTAITASFILILFIVNYQNRTELNTELQASFHGKKVNQKPTAEEILSSLSYRDKSSLTRTEKKVLKKEFKVQLGVYLKSKVTGNKKDGDKAALTILAIIVAIGLAILLAFLACSLSCSGNDGLAVVVGIVGLAAIIWLLIYVIKKINQKGQTKKGSSP
ncbi:MAG: hypothetical protein ACM3H8_06740 [Sphingobacteriales bacterium]